MSKYKGSTSVKNKESLKCKQFRQEKEETIKNFPEEKLELENKKIISRNLFVDNDKLTFNTCLETGGYLFLGTDHGLYCLPESEGEKGLNKIDGFSQVHQLEVLSSLDSVILLEGETRQLSLVSIKTLTSFKKMENVIPKNVISELQNCHMFCLKDKDFTDITLAITTGRKVYIFTWRDPSFKLVGNKDVPDLITSVIISKEGSSVIIAADKMYEIDMKTLEMEAFLDSTDPLLYFVFYGGEDFKTVLNIFDISKDGDDPQYLICYSKCGVFVDGEGRKKERAELSWRKYPHSINFCSSLLFLCYYGEINVYNLDQKYSPISKLALNNPLFLGPGKEKSSAILCSRRKQTNELFQVEVKCKK